MKQFKYNKTVNYRAHCYHYEITNAPHSSRNTLSRGPERAMASISVAEKARKRKRSPSPDQTCPDSSSSQKGRNEKHINGFAHSPASSSMQSSIPGKQVTTTIDWKSVKVDNPGDQMLRNLRTLFTDIEHRPPNFCLLAEVSRTNAADEEDDDNVIPPFSVTSKSTPASWLADRLKNLHVTEKVAKKHATVSTWKEAIHAHNQFVMAFWKLRRFGVPSDSSASLASSASSTHTAKVNGSTPTRKNDGKDAKQEVEIETEEAEAEETEECCPPPTKKPRQEPKKEVMEDDNSSNDEATPDEDSTTSSQQQQPEGSGNETEEEEEETEEEDDEDYNEDAEDSDEDYDPRAEGAGDEEDEEAKQTAASQSSTTNQNASDDASSDEEDENMEPEVDEQESNQDPAEPDQDNSDDDSDDAIVTEDQLSADESDNADEADDEDNEDPSRHSLDSDADD